MFSLKNHILFRAWKHEELYFVDLLKMSLNFSWELLDDGMYGSYLECRDLKNVRSILSPDA